jgi:hypothetical protein
MPGLGKKVQVDAGRDLLATTLPGNEQIGPPPGEPPVQLIEERPLTTERLARDGCRDAPGFIKWIR